MLGVGEGKSSESNEARAAAFGNAVRNMRPIPRYEHRTIFGDVSAKVGGTGVELFTRPPGESSIALYCVPVLCGLLFALYGHGGRQDDNKLTMEQDSVSGAPS